MWYRSGQAAGGAVAVLLAQVAKVYTQLVINEKQNFREMSTSHELGRGASISKNGAPSCKALRKQLGEP
jgi:hypothetical protein